MAVVVAELVAVAVAVVAAVVLLVEVADRLDVDPKKGFGPAWRTHSSHITQSSAQSECFCRRVHRYNSGQRQKGNSFSILAVAYITRHSLVKSIGEGRKKRQMGA